MVLDDDHIPVQPVLSYLKYLHNLDRSPNTIRATAYRLKLFWEYLRDEQLCWKEMDVAQLAAFIPWLRRLDPTVISIAPHKAHRTNATIDLALGAVYGFYSYHMRLATIPELPLYQLALPHRGRYKPFLHGIAQAKPEATRVVTLKREQRQPKTLTSEQIQQLLDACTHKRDRFLLALMYETGMRVGQCLGLTHADLSVEDRTLQIVPRLDNPNGARAKTRTTHTIPLPEQLLHLYTEYLVDELCAMQVESLPDFVFVNLWEGEIGRPMSYAAVRSLAKRLTRRTAIPFAPHMLRHSRATSWIKDDKLALPVVSRLLTHASIQTTSDIYLHLRAEYLREALAKGKEKTHGPRTLCGQKKSNFASTRVSSGCGPEIPGSYPASMRKGTMCSAPFASPVRIPHSKMSSSMLYGISGIRAHGRDITREVSERGCTAYDIWCSGSKHGSSLCTRSSNAAWISGNALYAPGSFKQNNTPHALQSA